MNDLKIGFAQVNINPQLGIGINGYYIPRFAKGYLDDLTASALAVQCGGNTVIMVSADNVGFGKMFDQYRNAVAQDHCRQYQHAKTGGYAARTAV